MAQKYGKMFAIFTIWFIFAVIVVWSMDLKEFSKWLWDIAKYVVTAIVVTSFLGNFEKNSLKFYLVSMAFAAVLFLLGVYLQHQSKNNKKDNNNKKE